MFYPLSRDLISLVAHFLSVEEVHILEQCSKGFYQLLHSDKYWSARARYEGVYASWLELNKITSWYNIYHARVALIDYDAERDKLIPYAPGNTYYDEDNEEGDKQYPLDLNLVLQWKGVVWNLAGELSVIGGRSEILVPLSEYCIKPRINPDGSFAIVENTRSGYDFDFVYINEENELWLFSLSYECKKEDICHILLARDVKVAGYWSNQDRVYLMVVTLTGEILFYQEQCDEGYQKIFTEDRDEELDLQPIDPAQFTRLSHPEQDKMVQIAIHEDGNGYAWYYFRTSDSKCYCWNEEKWNEGEGRWSEEEERWSELPPVDVLCQVPNGVAFYHQTEGWRIHEESEDNIYPYSGPEKGEVIMIRGLPFCLYRGNLYSAPSIVFPFLDEQEDVFVVKVTK